MHKNRRCAKEQFGVRDISPSDIPFVREIDRLSFSAEDQYPDDFYDSLIRSGLQTIVATESRGDIAGYASIDWAHKPIRLRSIATHPRCRKKGCAEFLIRHILDTFGLPVARREKECNGNPTLSTPRIQICSKAAKR